MLLCEQRQQLFQPLLCYVDVSLSSYFSIFGSIFDSVLLYLGNTMNNLVMPFQIQEWTLIMHWGMPFEERESLWRKESCMYEKDEEQVVFGWPYFVTWECGLTGCFRLLQTRINWWNLKAQNIHRLHVNPSSFWLVGWLVCSFWRIRFSDSYY